MNLLESNLTALAETNPDAAARLTSESRADGPHQRDVEWIVARTGAPTAKTGGTFLHSTVDPEREARRITGSEAVLAADAVVFFGFGLGYYVRAYLETASSGDALVFEPDGGLLIEVFNRIDLSAVLRNPRFHLFMDCASAALRERDGETIEVVQPKQLTGLAPGFYAALNEEITRFRSRRAINSATLKRFGRLWVRNLARNVPLLWRCRGVEQLRGIAAGLPALVVAAGPSLDDVLPRLPDLRQRCVLIAVDTSLSACRRQGTEPDFTVVVDPQYWNTRHLDRQSGGRTVLVSESATHPRVFRLLDGPTLLCGSLFPLGSFFENFTGAKGRLGAGGSVATTAWDLARLLGSCPLFMAGLDLGFPRRNTHFRGSFFEERTALLSRRLRPAEHLQALILFDADPSFVAGNHGGPTLSDRRMSLYRWWFEHQMRLHPETATFNLSSQGTRIEGMPFRCLEEVLALPHRREEIDCRISAVLQDSERSEAPIARSEQASYTAFFSVLDELAAITTHGERVTRRMIEALRHGAEIPSLAELDSIDDRIRALPHREIVGFLLQEELERLRGRRAADLTGSIEDSLALYTALNRSAAFHRDVFLKFMPCTARYSR